MEFPLKIHNFIIIHFYLAHWRVHFSKNQQICVLECFFFEWKFFFSSRRSYSILAALVSLFCIQPLEFESTEFVSALHTRSKWEYLLYRKHFEWAKVIELHWTIQQNKHTHTHEMAKQFAFYFIAAKSTWLKIALVASKISRFNTQTRFPLLCNKRTNAIIQCCCCCFFFGKRCRATYGSQPSSVCPEAMNFDCIFVIAKCRPFRNSILIACK